MPGSSKHLRPLLEGDLTTIIVFSVAWGILVLCALMLYLFYSLSVGSDGEDYKEANLLTLLQAWAKTLVRNTQLDSKLQFNHDSSSHDIKSSSSRKESKGEESSSSKRSGWSFSGLFGGNGSQKSSFRVTPVGTGRNTSSTLPSNATSHGTAHASNYHSVQTIGFLEQTAHQINDHEAKTIPLGPYKFIQKPRKMVLYSNACSLSDENCHSSLFNRLNQDRRRKDETSKRDDDSSVGFELSCRLDFLPSILETQSSRSRDDATPRSNKDHLFQPHQYHIKAYRGDVEELNRPIDILLPSSSSLDGALRDHCMEIDLPDEKYYQNDNDEEDAKSIPLDD